MEGGQRLKDIKETVIFRKKNFLHNFQKKIK